MGCGESTHAVVHQEAAASPSPGVVKSFPVNFHQKYVLEKKVGEGTFSRVYACKSKRGGSVQDLVVKISDLGGRHSKAMREMAEKEVSILERIQNRRHCCQIIDFMSGQHFHYIVMERCSMTVLQALESMQDVTERSVARIVKQMFSGISSVHALGVVHRDVKPDSFLCSGPDATVKLIDFGLAEVLPSSSEGITGYCGTAPYMSPEMLLGSKYGKPTDVWSLGVIVYTLLCGEFPYVPEKPCKELMKAAIASGVPEPSFACKVADIEHSRQALEFMKALLCREPARRPQAIEALEDSWLGLGSGEKHSLRASLHSAERVGALGTPYAADKQKLDSVDRALLRLQLKYNSRQVYCSHAEQAVEGMQSSVELKVENQPDQESIKVDDDSTWRFTIHM